MNLRKKKLLAARTLNVGKERIIFVNSRLAEIKEAITKQDINDLKSSGAIIVREVRGRRKIVKKIGKRSVGNVRKKVNKRKENYITMTRKLRKCIKEMKEQGKISRESFLDIRKKIKNKYFKSLNHLKEYIRELKS